MSSSDDKDGKQEPSYSAHIEIEGPDFSASIKVSGPQWLIRKMLQDLDHSIGELS